MFTNHRRALAATLGLLAALAFMLVAVGRHPEQLAPLTTWRPIGDLDAAIQRASPDVRTGPFTAVATFLSFLGGGWVTTPLRIAFSLWLLVRRRFMACGVFVLAWAGSEALMTWLKVLYHRGRPPDPLVVTHGFSFPSGHATAGAALAIAVVMVFFPPGPHRRKWELAAGCFAFVMAMSRVYLSAHWISDVVAGVLLGASIAIGAGAIVTEVATMLSRRGVIPAPGTPPGDPLDPRLD